MTIKHILIAEDDGEMLAMMSDFLRTKGYMVSTATAELEIISVLNAKRVDLILLDVMLGFENGIQICKNIKRSIPNWHIYDAKPNLPNLFTFSSIFTYDPDITTHLFCRHCHRQTMR